MGPDSRVITALAVLIVNTVSMINSPALQIIKLSSLVFGGSHSFISLCCEKFQLYWTLYKNMNITHITYSLHTPYTSHSPAYPLHITYSCPTLTSHTPCIPPTHHILPAYPLHITYSLHTPYTSHSPCIPPAHHILPAYPLHITYSLHTPYIPFVSGSNRVVSLRGSEHQHRKTVLVVVISHVIPRHHTFSCFLHLLVVVRVH